MIAKRCCKEPLATRRQVSFSITASSEVSQKFLRSCPSAALGAESRAQIGQFWPMPANMWPWPNLAHAHTANIGSLLAKCCPMLGRSRPAMHGQRQILVDVAFALAKQHEDSANMVQSWARAG